MSTRNIPAYRDPAVMLIDQLKEIYIDGVLERSTRRNGIRRSCARITWSAVTSARTGVDDPDQQFYENYACGSERNYTGYCNADTDKLIDRQSMEADPGKRKQIVWEIEKRLAEDGARPIIFYPAREPAGSPSSRAHDDGQRQLQRLAPRRRLARQIAGPSLGFYRRLSGLVFSLSHRRRSVPMSTIDPGLRREDQQQCTR